MTEYIAQGENYILTTEKEIAAKIGMRFSRFREDYSGFSEIDDMYEYIVFPESGCIYDFTDAKQPIWVCGEPYHTCAKGNSRPVNVQGEIIEITNIRKGNVTEFAEIDFIVRRGA